MPFIIGRLTRTHPSEAPEILEGLTINVVTDVPTVDRSAPWFATWDVPTDNASRRFMEYLLTDDGVCTLMLADGRVSPFSFAFDGTVLRMQGLQPLQHPGVDQ